MSRTFSVFAVFAISMPLAAAESPATEGGAAGKMDPLVVGGEPVAEGKWPDVAAILDGDQPICTGTLIAPTVVLTAGHCLAVPGDYAVRLDAVDATAGGEVIAATRTVVYPGWETHFDVALVILEQPAITPPRPAAIGCGSDFIADGAEIALVGYGATDINGEVYDNRLREGRAAIADHDCSEGDGCMASVNPGGELTARADGVNSCFGDSGGPLYLPTPAGDLLAGVVSRGTDSITAPCQGGGIYVRVDAVAEWIEEETTIELPEPDCDGSDGSDGDGDSGNTGDDGAGDEAEAAGGCSASGSSGGIWAIALILLLLSGAGRRGCGSPRGDRASRSAFRGRGC